MLVLFYGNEYRLFSRLASICDHVEVRTSVTQQSFFSDIANNPIIILFLTLVPFIVKVVFTQNFTNIPMVCFGILQCFSEQSRGQWDIF
jgi:hypothetical protein